jgi:hypothetical protein
MWVPRISTLTALFAYYYSLKLSDKPRWNNIGAFLYSATWATCIGGFLAFQTSSSVLTEFYAAGLTHSQTVLLMSIADITLHFGPLVAMILRAPTKTTLSVQAFMACLLPLFLLYPPTLVDVAYPGVSKELLLVMTPIIALVAFILKYKSPVIH